MRGRRGRAAARAARRCPQQVEGCVCRAARNSAAAAIVAGCGARFIELSPAAKCYRIVIVGYVFSLCLQRCSNGLVRSGTNKAMSGAARTRPCQKRHEQGHVSSDRWLLECQHQHALSSRCTRSSMGSCTLSRLAHRCAHVRACERHSQAVGVNVIICD